MDHPRGLDGRLILVVQRSRHIARALASTLVAKGAQVVLAKGARLDLADLPQLAAAVLNGHSRELSKLLEARKIPFVVYTTLDQSECQFTTRTKVIPKTAPVTEVVAAVEQLLVPWRQRGGRHGGANANKKPQGSLKRSRLRRLAVVPFLN